MCPGLMLSTEVTSDRHLPFKYTCIDIGRTSSNSLLLSQLKMLAEALDSALDEELARNTAGPLYNWFHRFTCHSGK